MDAGCAPAIAAPQLLYLWNRSNLRHIEYFHDQVRIERMLFDGFVEQRDGFMRPDDSRPGLGLTLKRKDALRYAA